MNLKKNQKGYLTSSSSSFADLQPIRVESPHKLKKSMPNDYKFVGHSSMNTSFRKRLINQQFQLFQSNFYDSGSKIFNLN